MKQLLKAFGVLLILLGISLLIHPDFLFGFMENHSGNLWLYIFAIAIRVAIGILLIRSAKESKYPSIFYLLGFLFLGAAIVLSITLIFGPERIQELIPPLITAFRPIAYIPALLSMALGAFLIYAVSGARYEKEKIEA